MRVGLIQLNSSDDPLGNLPQTRGLVAEAIDSGAQFVLTPEVTNCVSASRTRQNEVLTTEDLDPTLAALRKDARTAGVWLLIGSLALKAADDTRFVNRSFLIDPKGDIVARYDKMHMFDVTLSETETYRESDGYKPGETAVVTCVGDASVGLTICYDLRFPYLYRDLAKQGASILTVPSAFSPDTGPGHWETLLRARAIETGSFVLAPAQTGTHRASRGRARRTWGHSLAIDPRGTVLVDGAERTGVTCVDLDLGQVADVRRRLPSLAHDRAYAMVRHE
ncbi:MAG: carbon-nitrogen hydrolase family protein [Paracoccaceae bacterium]